MDLHRSAQADVDVALVGAGVMSATLATLLKELNPELRIAIFESLDAPAEESSNAWNNAGTGHAALCELNYTSETNGNVDISRALKVNNEFDLTRQFWSYLVRTGALANPDAFIHPVAHVSFVHGAENVGFLKRRYEAMSAHHCFSEMEYSEDRAVLAEWMPLVMEGRDPVEAVAGTRDLTGTDCDFGALTRALIANLQQQPGFAVQFRHRVTDVQRSATDGVWNLAVHDGARNMKKQLKAAFVFLGAGGGALPLLQKSNVPEGKGFAGFPVSGLWLRCDNPALADRHSAKVYGKASIGAPPMSVPHLDARVVDGKRSLLFGPYAGFSTKFLKNGSPADFFASIRPDNIAPLIAVGRDNFDLTKYLVGQVLESSDGRFKALQEYFPNAKASDWRLEVAGQRVQVIVPDKKKTGSLQFGTEVVTTSDGSLAAVLGASPGASTSVSIMLGILNRAFKPNVPAWTAKLTEMIPSYGRSIADDAELCYRVRSETAGTLRIVGPPQPTGAIA